MSKQNIEIVWLQIFKLRSDIHLSIMIGLISANFKMLHLDLLTSASENK